MSELTDRKIIVVRRPTRLEDLVVRFGTKGQAKFYLEHSALDFSDYEREHDNYYSAIGALNTSLSRLPLRIQYLEREFLPNFIFGHDDIVVVIGQDGLVVNTAKYLNEHSIIGVNPDPERFDGVLLPFSPEETGTAVVKMMQNKLSIRSITMAEAELNDGQKLLAFNDLFIGAKSHVSATYTLNYEGKTERHSSSGVIVSTPAGATGWLSSALNMAKGVFGAFSKSPSNATTESCFVETRLSWEDRKLIFVVREPFVSVSTSAEIVAGFLQSNEDIVIESRMPENGVIFSDGIESDCLEFNAGSVAKIKVAARCTKLVEKG